MEVAQEGVAPLSQGPAEAGDLGIGQGGVASQDLLGERPAGGRIGFSLHGPDALGALLGDPHFVVPVVGGDRFIEAVLLAFGEVFLSGAEDVADPVLRVSGPAAVAGEVLLDAAADLRRQLG